MEFCKNDYVMIVGEPDLYIIEEVNSLKVIVKGYSYRIKKEVDIGKIIPASFEVINKEKEKLDKKTKIIVKQNSQRLKKRVVYGTILHIDGDKDYLESCLSLYKEMNIFANGIYIKENDIKDKIEELLLKLTPDIIVITGHDVYNGRGAKELDNYVNSGHFCDALRVIRRHFDKDSVCVIVGACCSHFEALIANGANFASSPARINIHTYDPAVIAIKMATTSCNKIIDFEQTLMFIENKKDAFGGIETKGKMKILL